MYVYMYVCEAHVPRVPGAQSAETNMQGTE